VRRILGGALLLAAIGCTHRLVPSTYPVHPDKIPALTAGAPLAIFNGITEIREVFLASRMGHEYLGDLMAWTSTAVQLLSGELQNRSFSVLSQKFVVSFGESSGPLTRRADPGNSRRVFEEVQRSQGVGGPAKVCANF
jgi:hypothetical protein